MERRKAFAQPEGAKFSGQWVLVAAVKTGIPQVPGPAETPNPSIPSLLPGSPIYLIVHHCHLGD